MNRLLCTLVWLLLLVPGCYRFSPVAVPLATTDIRFNTTESGTIASIDLVGLDADALQPLAAEIANLKEGEGPPWFAVYVGSELKQEADLPPRVLGSYQAVGDVIRFEPKYPHRAGVHYVSVFDSALAAGVSLPPTRIVKVFQSEPPPKIAATTILAVYPSGVTLPENQLKFYILFSAPMSRGNAYRHLHLLSEDGKEIEYPFLELGEELWDPTGTRFTLFFDPGRVKRELRPREELGPPLVEGKSCILVIDDDWLDAAGQPIQSGVRKSYEVTAPDNEQPDPATWKLQAPQGGGIAPVILSFPEPLDRALLDRVLTVVTSEGVLVDGQIAVGDDEKEWRFIPTQPWKGGTYQIVVDTILEDLAGNSIARPFEVDFFRPVQRQTIPETVRLAFTVQEK